MFAYCNNNPIVQIDLTGCYALGIERNNVVESGAVNYDGIAWATIGIAIGNKLNELWDDFEDSIKKTLAQITTPRTYRSDTEEHHMAAKGSYKAKAAQDVLAKVFPNGVEDTNNKVMLSTALHRRVHTNLYYAITNTLIVDAYNSANGDKYLEQQNVLSALSEIRATLIALETLVP